MRVLLTFQLHGEDEPHELEMSSTDYFDPPEEGELVLEDAVERHVFLHDYLGVESERVKWIVARAWAGGRSTLRRAQYLDGDRSIMEHIVDVNGDEEIILSTRLPSRDWHTTRLLKPRDASWSVSVNALSADGPTRDQPAALDFCGRWEFEDRQSFSRVGCNL